MSRIVASPQRVERRREDISARPCDAAFVNIQISGTSVVRQRGIETKLPPGSLALLDARQPFEMRFEGAFQQLCLHVPMAWLEERSFDPARAIARPVDCARLVAPWLPDALDEEERTDALTSQVDHLLDRLWLHYEEGAADTLADQHLSLIQLHVAENCANADLDPSAVAERFRLSVRYVHKLFARSGISFGQFLLQCRLDRGLRALHEHPRQPIADVAKSAGFKSPSHFSRCFRRRYGQMPSAIRDLPTWDGDDVQIRH